MTATHEEGRARHRPASGSPAAHDTAGLHGQGIAAPPSRDTADAAGWAARYAAAGLAVLPTHWPTPDGCSCRRAGCDHPGKHPLTPHGKDDASTDAATVAEWWRRWPSANVGIRPPDGVIVLDVDPRHQGASSLAALVRQHGHLTHTWAARTGGGGLHAWYGYGGPLRGQLCPGVDIKSHAGYVLAPPSRHASGGRYEWANDHPVAPLPGWLRGLLAPPAPRPVPSSREREPGAADAGLVRTVAQAQEGGRNAALHWAACRAWEQGGDPDLLAEIEAAALATGLTAPEVRKTLGSAERTVIGGAA